MGYEAERRVALSAVIAASRLCRAVQESLVAADTLTKRDRSPVTVADFGAQALVSRALQNSFPADPLVGEEEAGALREEANDALRAQVLRQVRAIEPELDEEEILAAIDRGDHPGGARGRHWTLDPIDGTKGFLRGEQYAVALALIDEGEVVLGVLGCPNLPLEPGRGAGPRGSIFCAQRGQGTTQQAIDGGGERPIAVDSISDPVSAVFCESVEAAHSAHGEAARVAELLGVSAPPLRIDSQCKYGAVARGDASIYLRLPTRADYVEKIWDHAAGALVVREAGGQVSDALGRPLDFSRGRTLSENSGVIATNGKIHAKVLAAVSDVLAAKD